MTKLAFVSRTVAHLRTRYGVRMDYYWPTTNALNLATGQISRTYNLIQINKVLILPTKLLRDFQYDIAFLAANKNFTFGGFFDKDNVVVAVMYKDMRGHKPEVEDHIIYLGKKWLVKNVQEYADLQCYIMEVLATSGEPFNQIYNVMAESTLNFTQIGSL